MNKTYAVYLEICEIPTKQKADELAKIVQGRFDDLEENVNVCISEYYTRVKETCPSASPNGPLQQ